MAYPLQDSVIKEANACRKKKRSSETLPAEVLGIYLWREATGKVSVTAPCAIEYTRDEVASHVKMHVYL